MKLRSSSYNSEKVRVRKAEEIFFKNREVNSAKCSQKVQEDMDWTVWYLSTMITLAMATREKCWKKNDWQVEKVLLSTSRTSWMKEETTASRKAMVWRHCVLFWFGFWCGCFISVTTKTCSTVYGKESSGKQRWVYMGEEKIGKPGLL